MRWFGQHVMRLEHEARVKDDGLPIAPSIVCFLRIAETVPIENQPAEAPCEVPYLTDLPRREAALIDSSCGHLLRREPHLRALVSAIQYGGMRLQVAPQHHPDATTPALMDVISPAMRHGVSVASGASMSDRNSA